MVHALELLEVELPVLPVLQIIQGELDVRGHLVAVHRVLCGNDAVTSHEARRLSCGRIDGVEAVRHRVDAIAATTSS